MEDPSESASRVDPVSESLHSADKEAKGYPIASTVAASLLGFFSGAACFGTAYFATSDDGFLPLGITRFGLAVLLLCSVAVGALAGRSWKSAIIVQLLAMSPYVALVMLSEPQTFLGRLSYPGVLWTTSALGVYVGRKVGAWANAA